VVGIGEGADEQVLPLPDLTAEVSVAPILVEEGQQQLLQLYDTITNKVKDELQ